VLGVTLLAPVRASALPPLAAHHAVYSLSLKPGANSGAIAASGAMRFDFADSCDGWVTAQHMVVDLTDNTGHEQHMVTDYATIENHEGTKLTFHSRQGRNGTITSLVDGVAVLSHPGGGGYADFTTPDHKRVLLPAGTKLPTAHTAALLRAAEAGQKFMAAPLFDGTDDGGAQDSFVVSGRHYPAGPGKFAMLDGMSSTGVRIAFYDQGKGDQSPEFETAMRYYANGVASELEMNFGDFTLLGHLDQLAPKAAPHC